MIKFEDIEVTVHRREDGWHEAYIDGELMTKLSPLMSAAKKIRAWRVVNADGRVEVSGLPANDKLDERGTNKYVEKNIETLKNNARRIWFNRQPEVIENARRTRIEADLLQARKDVAALEQRLAATKAHLAKLEEEAMNSAEEIVVA